MKYVYLIAAIYYFMVAGAKLSWSESYSSVLVYIGFGLLFLMISYKIDKKEKN